VSAISVTTEDTQPDPSRGTCTPCRGTGRVISALGGDPHEVTCPWCGGTGKYTPGHDAQEAPAEREGQ
jgi:DnaJ-class molecular chaperone